MNPRFATIVCALAFPLLCCCPSTFASDTTGRPNILFLLVGDQRNDTLGCAGHPILQTPVIDSLAAEEVRFRNALKAEYELEETPSSNTSAQP